MAAPSTPWGDQMVAMLRRGPRKREDVTQKMMALIPPGVAYRSAVRHRTKEREKRAAQGRASIGAMEIPDNVTITTGRRMMATQVVNTAIRDNRLILYMEKNEQWVRLGPRIVHGPTYRMAIARCGQSHGGVGENCALWFHHVDEAMELFEAYSDKTLDPEKEE